MIFKIIFYVFMITIVVFGFGCSSGKSSPVMPSDSILVSDLPTSESTFENPESIDGGTLSATINHKLISENNLNQTNRHLLASHTLNFNPETQNLTLTTNRNAYSHWEVSDYVDTSYEIHSFDQFAGILDVDFTITNTNPFHVDTYDLRLIVYTDNLGSRLFNPDEWTAYHDISGGALINPFKAYAKNEINRKFEYGKSHTERLQLYFPAGYTSLNFSIDASWPSNCDEPYSISYFTQGPLYSKQGTLGDASVRVHDWQDDIDAVNLYCASICGQSWLPFTFDKDNTWEITFTNETGATPNDYTGIICAISNSIPVYDLVTITVLPGTDPYPPEWDIYRGIYDAVPWDSEVTIHWKTATDANSPPVEYLLYKDADDSPWDQEPVIVGNNDPYKFEGLINGQPYWFGVRCQDSADPPNIDANIRVLSATPYYTGPPVDWVKGWGDSENDWSYSVATDSYNNVYTTGYFNGTVDFGDGNPISTNGSSHAFLCKYNPNGALVWVKTWGDQENSSGKATTASSVIVDLNDYLYIAGSFTGTVDFGDGNPVSSDYHNAFILKLDCNKTFKWVKTWATGSCYSVYSNESNVVYAAGSFIGTVDFGDGNPVSSNGGQDAYLLKLDGNNTCIWVKTWGGSSWDEGTSVTADNINGVYVLGFFHDSVDFGDGNSISSHGERDVYLTRFDSSGYFQWVRTWGDQDIDQGLSVTADSANNIYATGSFYGTVDFGDGNPITSRAWGAYLCKFNPNSSLIWVKTWGG